MEEAMENGFTLRWKIKNLSYCWLKKGEPIESPAFDVGPTATTKWSLLLYPMGIVNDDHVGVYLRRDKDTCGPNIIEVSFQFAILDHILSSVLEVSIGTKRGFAIGSVSGNGKFVPQNKIFDSARNTILPQDTLTIQCTIWIKDEIPIKTEHNKLLWTVFELNYRYFSWAIDGFSTLRPGQRNQVVIMNMSKKVLVSFHLVSGFRREINLEIMSCDKSLKSFNFDIHVITSNGDRVNFGCNRFFADFEKIKKLLISREQLIERESQYLPNDILHLACKCVFSTGDILYLCEETNFGIMEDKPAVSHNEPQQIQPLVEDLKSMYDNAILCDIELRTATKTFPAHKNILSARSPVFRRMFSNDMKEKNTGRIDIADLEDDTVHRMLLYMYTDALEDLQFESASKLYSAADKYAIFFLKERCSSFLKDNMSPTNACDILILADRHEDQVLKSAAQSYILSHDKEVFGSPEWQDFMATNLQMAADTMYRKLCPS